MQSHPKKLFVMWWLK